MAKLLEIFRSGRHVTVDGKPTNFSRRDLEEIAASYNTAAHEAPVVIGHPKTDDPAFGWIKALVVRGDRLEAVADQIAPAFAEAHRAGAYKKVSSSFYPPEHPNNPAPGKWYLRHVGMLGAVPPSVKGLRAAEFAEGDVVAGATTIETPMVETTDAQASTLGGALTPLREWLSTTFGPEAAEAAIPEATLAGADIGAPLTALGAWLSERYKTAAADAATTTGEAGAAGDGSASTATADHAERHLTETQRAQSRELARREAAIAQRERDARRMTHVSFCEQLVASGRPLLAPREDVLGLLEHLATAQVPRDAVCFAEGEVRTAEEIFLDMLKRAPKSVDFSERSSELGAPLMSDDPRAVARAAQDYMAAQAAKGIHVSTGDAIRAVKAGR